MLNVDESMPEMLDADSVRDFTEEAREYIVALNRDLLELEDRGTGADAELVNEAFRAIHTIKGLSGMLGFGSINELAHRMEDALAAVREGEVEVAGRFAQALFDALDLLGEMVEAVARGDTGPRRIDDAIEVLSAALEKTRKSGNSEAGGPAGEISAYRLRLSFKRDFGSSKKKMLAGLKALDSNGKILSVTPEDIEKRLRSRKKITKLEAELVVTTALPEKKLCEKLGIGTLEIEEFVQPTAVEEESTEPQADEQKADPRAAESRKSSATTGTSQAIRVDVGKLDCILDLVGELVIARSRYNHLAGRAISDLARANVASGNVISLRSELNEVESSMSRTLSELQDAVMKARLVPLGSVSGKFRRAVRDLASRAGKRIRFESIGGEAELDKKVIDQIGDPLMHLIRNAVDHGIETPAERRRQNKPEEGCITLSSSREGDRVVIEIADDGRGLDRARIIERAVERGMLSPEKAAEVSDQQIQEIIAAPGFSTSREVTDVSGRGVGMDVVREALANLKGTLEIKSSFGKGTTFRIKLPLTMAIVDALLVSVRGESYAIAVGSVKEILEIDENAIYRVAGRECFQANGRVIPLVRLESALECADISPRPGLNGNRTTVVVDSGESEVGLMVDRVIGQQEIVIKALSRRFENVAEISGGSVLGDGSVCLILDVPLLVAKAKGEHTGRLEASA